MTFDVRIAGDIATITPRSRHTESEFESFVRALLRTIDAGQTLRLLIDISRVEADPTAERILAVAKRLLSLRAHLAPYHALVVSDAQQEAVAHDVASWAKTNGAEIQVFWAVEEAEAWLALLRPGQSDA